MDHCLSFIVSINTLVGHGISRPGWIQVRNTVFHDRLRQKRGGAYLYNTQEGSDKLFHADYNAYCWMPKSTPIYGYRGPATQGCVKGLKNWEEFCGYDKHSLEVMMTEEKGVYPGTYRLIYSWTGKNEKLRGDLLRGSGAPALETEDFILPADSPLRGAGENGSDIGPRWEKFRDPK